MSAAAASAVLHNPLDGESTFFAFEIPTDVPSTLNKILPSNCANFLASTFVAPTPDRLEHLRQSLMERWAQEINYQYLAIFWYYRTLGLPYDMTGVYFLDAVDLFVDLYLRRSIHQTPVPEIQATLEKYRLRSTLAQESLARQSRIQRQPMHALSLLAEDEDDDKGGSESDWELSNDYLESESESGEEESDDEYVPEEEDKHPSRTSHTALPDTSSSPPSKRLRLDPTPEISEFDFLTSPEASHYAICGKWVASFCRVLPGLEEIARQYLKTETSTLDYDTLCCGLRRSYLGAGLRYSKPNNFCQAKRRVTGWILKGMKSIPSARHQTGEWRHAVFDSGLAAVMMLVGDPSYVVEHAKTLDGENDVVDVFRYQRLQDSLTALLLNWMPESVSSSWTPRNVLFQAVPFDQNLHNSGKRIVKPSDFRKALTDNPWLLPRAAIPETVFFLHSLENFLRIYDLWIGPALQAGGWYLDLIGNDARKRGNFYSRFIQYLTKEVGSRYRQGEYDHANALEVVFARTVEANDTEKEFETYLRRNTLSEKDRAKREKEGEVLYPQIRSCTGCCDKPPEHQCTQIVYVTHRPNTAEMEGCGISRCPKRRKTPSGTSKVHDPELLNLRAIRSDPAIMVRCQRQIFYVVDTNHNHIPMYSEKTKSEFVEVPVLDEKGKLSHWKHEYVMDGIFFGPFSERILEKQRAHERNMRYMSPLKRGAKFSNYAAGKMYGGGAGRQGKGGALGDGYSYYARMEAQSIKGIHILMDIAQDAFFLECVAYFAFRGLWKRIRETVKMTDHIGMSGLNVFRCHDYVAPLHTDKDTSRGFCCTIRWRGIRALDEFAFCQPEWGYYIATESNLFWSFDSRHLHGTMLPSLDMPLSPLDGDPLDTIDQHVPGDGGSLSTLARRQPSSLVAPVQVPKRASSGYHQTNPEKNVSAAQRYDRAVRLRPDIHSLWRRRADL